MLEHVARDLGPALKAAARSRDAAAVGAAAGRLAGLLAELEALIEGSGIGSGAEAAAWIQVIVGDGRGEQDGRLGRGGSTDTGDPQTFEHAYFPPKSPPLSIHGYLVPRSICCWPAHAHWMVRLRCAA